MGIVTFAEFHEQGHDEWWPDVEVRPMGAADVAVVAVIYAERENASIVRATEVVLRWVELSSERLVLVATHEGLVQGYGKAEWLAPQARGGNAPMGWYLTGLVVAPTARRHGIGAQLTGQRIKTLAAMANEIWYFANSGNRSTIALHERHGFELHTHEFEIPGVVFNGGHGALYRLLITQP